MRPVEDARRHEDCNGPSKGASPDLIDARCEEWPSSGSRPINSSSTPSVRRMGPTMADDIKARFGVPHQCDLTRLVAVEGRPRVVTCVA